MIVIADDEQVHASTRPGNRGDPLVHAVEGMLAGHPEEVRFPADLFIPEGCPDVIVSADSGRVEVVGRAGNHGDPLVHAIEGVLAGRRKKSGFQPTYSFQKVVQT